MNQPVFNKLNFDQSALTWKVEEFVPFGHRGLLPLMDADFSES